MACTHPTDLMLHPSNKVHSMKLNGQTISNVSATSLTTTGLNATSGHSLHSWIIHTKLIDDVKSIGLTNSPNVIGPIQYYLYDSFSSVINATGDSVGQIVPVDKAEYIEKIVITANTTNGQPPVNLKLVLNGCFKEELLRTKAQVEQRSTVPGK
jgi:hypothetical protein